MGDLSREKASGAIGKIAEAEVFVDLEEALLEGGELEEFAGARGVAEEAEGGDFGALTGDWGAEFEETDPAFFVGGDGEWEEDIGEDIGDAGGADERHGFGGRFGVDGVMMIPEGIGEGGEEGEDFGGEGEVTEGANFRPMADDGGEGGEASLGVIGGALAGEIPEFWRDGKAGEFGAFGPPEIPEFAEIGSGGMIEGPEVLVGEKAAGTEEEGSGVRFAEDAEWEALGEEGEGEFIIFVAEGGGDGLEEGFVWAVEFGEGGESGGLFLEAEVGGGDEDIAGLGFGEGDEGSGAVAEDGWGE